jgi:hypothetical protein
VAPGGPLILMSTPYGKPGHFFEAWKGDEFGPDFIHTSRSHNLRLGKDHEI